MAWRLLNQTIFVSMGSIPILSIKVLNFMIFFTYYLINQILLIIVPAIAVALYS
jgi:hypothetical protein